MSKQPSWWDYVRSMIRHYPERKGRELNKTEQSEFDAVKAAIEITERMADGRKRLEVIDLTLWKSTHTIAGAALLIPCHKNTAQRWRSKFIREVAKNFRCDGLIS